MERLKKLRNRLAEIPGAVKVIRDAAAARDDGSFTEEERTQIAALVAERDTLERDIATEEQVLDLERVSDRIPREDESSGITVTERNPNGPFRNLGDQLSAIVQAARPQGDGGYIDPRLYKVGAPEAAAPTGAGSGAGADGGFLVQKDFTTALLDEAHDTGKLSRRCRRIPIGANSDGLEAPLIDETSRATGSRWGGVRIYRRGEADTVAASRPKVQKFKLDLEDLMGLAYATDRLIRDAPAMEAIFRIGFSEEFGFVMDEEILNGTGAGQCLGIRNSAVITAVAKEASQAADTIVAGNVVKMFARMIGVTNAEWFITAQGFEQLPLMTIGDQPVWQPPGNLVAAPFGNLLGRPVDELEQCEKLGDLGDILFLNLRDYILIEKGGVEQAESMHVRFIYDELTFRWKLRNNGAPRLKQSVTPYKANTGFVKSPFVQLAARA